MWLLTILHLLESNSLFYFSKTWKLLEEIENQARKLLVLIEQFDDYWKLVSFEDQLTDEQKTAVYYSVTLGYVNNLKNAIDSKDYVAMRRYRDGSWILESISKCLERIKQIQQ